MKHHDLKAQLDSFELLAQGISPVQLRKNDREFEVGDTCTFYEYDASTVKQDTGLPGIFTGSGTVKMPIVELLEKHEGLTPGWCLIVLDLPPCNMTRFI